MTTLTADWDLIEETHQVQKEFIQPANIQHVKGHQDEDVDFELLSLEAQLNVEADAEAGGFRSTMDPPLCPSVPLHPHTKVHLDIGGCTVTHYHRTAIRTAAGKEAFYCAVHERQKLNDEQFHTIDFEILAAISRRHSQSFIVCLQICSQIAAYSATQIEICDCCSPNCRRCCCPDTQNHFLQCPDAIVHDAVFKGLRSIRASLIKWGPPFSLAVTIVLCLGEWIEKDEVDINCIPPEHKKLCSITVFDWMGSVYPWMRH